MLEPSKMFRPWLPIAIGLCLCFSLSGAFIHNCSSDISEVIETCSPYVNYSFALSPMSDFFGEVYNQTNFENTTENCVEMTTQLYCAGSYIQCSNDTISLRNGLEGLETNFSIEICKNLKHDCMDIYTQVLFLCPIKTGVAFPPGFGSDDGSINTPPGFDSDDDAPVPITCPPGFYVPKDVSDPRNIFGPNSICALGCLSPQWTKSQWNTLSSVSIALSVLGIVLALTSIMSRLMHPKYCMQTMVFIFLISSAVYSLTHLLLELLPTSTSRCESKTIPLSSQSGPSACAAQSLIMLYTLLMGAISWTIELVNLTVKMWYRVSELTYTHSVVNIVLAVGVPIIPTVYAGLTNQYGFTGLYPFCQPTHSDLRELHFSHDGSMMPLFIPCAICLIIGAVALVPVLYVIGSTVSQSYRIESDKSFMSTKSHKSSKSFPSGSSPIPIGSSTKSRFTADFEDAPKGLIGVCLSKWDLISSPIRHAVPFYFLWLSIFALRIYASRAGPYLHSHFHAWVECIFDLQAASTISLSEEDYVNACGASPHDGLVFSKVMWVTICISAQSIFVTVIHPPVVKLMDIVDVVTYRFRVYKMSMHQSISISHGVNHRSRHPFQPQPHMNGGGDREGISVAVFGGKVESMYVIEPDANRVLDPDGRSDYIGFNISSVGSATTNRTAADRNTGPVGQAVQQSSTLSVITKKPSYSLNFKASAAVSPIEGPGFGDVKPDSSIIRRIHSDSKPPDTFRRVQSNEPTSRQFELSGRLGNNTSVAEAKMSGRDTGSADGIAASAKKRYNVSTQSNPNDGLIRRMDSPLTENQVNTSQLPPLKPLEPSNGYMPMILRKPKLLLAAKKEEDRVHSEFEQHNEDDALSLSHDNKDDSNFPSLYPEGDYGYDSVSVPVPTVLASAGHEDGDESAVTTFRFHKGDGESPFEVIDGKNAAARAILLSGENDEQRGAFMPSTKPSRTSNRTDSVDNTVSLPSDAKSSEILSGSTKWEHALYVPQQNGDVEEAAGNQLNEEHYIGKLTCNM